MGARVVVLQVVPPRAGDVIVMGTRALTGPARALLGSTADEVVGHADRPVLLVRQR
jgi:nucleotide-binding universal stress UspA family protein